MAQQVGNEANSAYPFSANMDEVKECCLYGKRSLYLHTLLESFLGETVGKGVVFHAWLNGERIHPKATFDMLSSSSFTPLIKRITWHIQTLGYVVVVMRRRAPLSMDGLTRVTEDLFVPDATSYQLRWVVHEGQPVYAAVPYAARTATSPGIISHAVGRPLRTYRDGTVRGAFIIVSEANAPMDDGRLASRVALGISKLKENAVLWQAFLRAFMEQSAPPIGTQMAPLAEPTKETPFIFGNVSRSGPPGSTLVNGAEATLANAAYQNTLQQLSQDSPMFAAPLTGSRELLEGRPQVNYPIGKVPAAVPLAAADTAGMIAMEAELQKILCIAIGLPIEFMLGDSSRVVAGAVGSLKRRDAAVSAMQEMLGPFLAWIVGEYLGDRLLAFMEADSLEGVTDGPANALSREQRDRGAIEDIDDSEAEDLDGSAGPVAGTEPSKAVKTYGLQTPESAKDGTAATATAEDENQKAARQLVHGQTGTDGFALPYTGPDKDEERRDDADPDPSKTRRRPFKRAGTRYAAKKRMRDAVDLIEVQFLNAPEVPTEIIVEAYDQGVITKDAFRHIYCLAAGFKEWQMLPIEEDSPADVRDQEASELAWKAEETRAAGGAGGGGKPGGRGVKRPASKAGGSAAKRSKPSGR